MTPVRLEFAASRSPVKHSTTEPLRSIMTWIREIKCIERHIQCGDGGLVARLRTHDRGLQGLTHDCSSSPRCINGYPDGVVFVQVCFSLSEISGCKLLEKGREIVSLWRLDCRLHNSPMIRESCVNAWLNGFRAESGPGKLGF